MSESSYRKTFVWEVSGRNDTGTWQTIVIADHPEEAFRLALSANTWDITFGVSIVAREAIRPAGEQE